MAKDDPYNKREMDILLKSIHDELVDIKANGEATLAQAIKTNGRVNKLERNLIVIGAVVATTVILRYEQALAVIKLFL